MRASCLRRPGGPVLLPAAFAVLFAGSPLAAGEPSLPDPTRPPEVTGGSGPSPETVGPPEELNLQSLLHGGERALAIINGRSLRVGDRIHGYTVEEIGRDRVVLAGGGGTRVLRLISTPGMKKVPEH